VILVTGATGTIGRPLVHLLSSAGEQVRALARHIGTQLDGSAPGVEVVRGDLSRPETIATVLHGVTSLFVHPRAVGPAAPTLLGLAAEHGVKHVAVLAALNVDDDPVRQPSRFNGDRNKEVEEAVTGSGLGWVSVRSGSFAASTLTMFAAQARNGDVIREPYAGFADAPIHEMDVASVLAAALLDNSLAGQKISVTGPQSLTHAEMVATIGEVIGRPLRYQEISPAEAADGMVAHGLPRPFAEAMMARYARELDRAAPISDAVDKILGRPARTYAQWAVDHAAAFQNPPPTPSQHLPAALMAPCYPPTVATAPREMP
jgi:uncharacterized protein YbjT (DUF2867 family)